MTDTSGTLVRRAEHSPFGSIYALTVGTISNNLRFPGQYFDSETSLAQNWFRDYEAKIGRYWEVEPVKIAEQPDTYDFSPYNYVKNNPINGLDSTGLSAEACIRPIKYATAAFPFKHCYIWFSDGTSLSYAPGAVGEDANPFSIFNHCYLLLPDECGDCSDDCLRKEMKSNLKNGITGGWWPFWHDCCDAVRRAVKKCHCKMPAELAFTNGGL